MNTRIVRRMSEADISAVAEVHSHSFTRQLDSVKWVTCNFNAHPRIKIFVIEESGEIAGYIQWSEKSGFRKEVVLELEQIAVLPKFRSQGFGTSLITLSLDVIKEELLLRGAVLKNIIVTTRTDNGAQSLYKKTLNAQIETVIPNLYSADEAILIARK